MQKGMEIYPRAAVERAMKVQEVILRRFAEISRQTGVVLSVMYHSRLTRKLVTSCLGFSFCVRVSGPPALELEDLFVPVGKVVLIEFGSSPTS